MCSQSSYKTSVTRGGREGRRETGSRARVISPSMETEVFILLRVFYAKKSAFTFGANACIYFTFAESRARGCAGSGVSGCRYLYQPDARVSQQPRRSRFSAERNRRRMFLDQEGTRRKLQPQLLAKLLAGSTRRAIFPCLRRVQLVCEGKTRR